MFTGLVEEIGNVQDLQPAGAGTRFTIQCEQVLPDANVGDSISVNGCCLTVVEKGADWLAFEAGTETLSRTNLGDLRDSSPVNLERSLKPSDRMGGHFVSGHIDAVGKVDQRVDDQEWATFWFQVPRELTLQMASKGSVAVDGISLTLVDVEDDRFSVALIPHTLSVTTLGNRQVGDKVNIETDILAKYVQRQLSAKTSNST